jgi:hypothetical protein
MLFPFGYLGWTLQRCLANPFGFNHWNQEPAPLDGMSPCSWNCLLVHFVITGDQFLNWTKHYTHFYTSIRTRFTHKYTPVFALEFQLEFVCWKSKYMIFPRWPRGLDVGRGDSLHCWIMTAWQNVDNTVSFPSSLRICLPLYLSRYLFLHPIILQL